MNEEQMREWREQEASEYFFKYLEDQAKETATFLAQRIVDGGIVPEDEQLRIATECATLTSITEIDFEEIETFYKEEK